MIALLLMAVLAVQGLQPGTGIVTGVLKTADGQPASRVRVGAVDINDPTQWLSLAETDAAGRFRLTNVPAGRYHIVGGRLNDLRYYPKGEDRSTAEEVNVEAARIHANVDFIVPGGVQRPLQPTAQQPSRVVSAPEVRAYQQFTAEKNLERKQQLLAQFERDFPKSSRIPEAYLSLMNLHAGNNDPRRTVEYAEQAIKSDPESISTLIQVSRMYAGLQTQLEKAVQYAEKAATLARVLEKQPAPAGTNASAWQAWAASMNSSAQSNLAWVKQMDAWQRKSLFSLVAPVRKK